MQTCRLIRAPNLDIEMLMLSRQSCAMLIHVVYPSPFQQLSCVSPGAVPRCFFRPRCSQTQGQRCWHVEGRVEGELGTHCPLRRMRAAGKWIVSFCLYIQVCWVLGSTSTQLQVCCCTLCGIQILKHFLEYENLHGTHLCL